MSGLTQFLPHIVGGGGGSTGPVAASQVTVTNVGYYNQQLLNNDAIMRLAALEAGSKRQAPAYTVSGSTITGYASLQALITAQNRPVVSEARVGINGMSQLITDNGISPVFQQLYCDSATPPSVILSAGIELNVNGLNGFYVSGDGVLIVPVRLGIGPPSGYLERGTAATVRLVPVALTPGTSAVLALYDFEIAAWSNPSGRPVTVELHNNSRVPAAPYPTGVTVVDMSNVRHDQLDGLGGGSGTALLDDEDFIAPEFLRPVAFQGYELGPEPAPGDPQTFVVVPAEMVAALQPDLDEAIDARIEAGGGTPGGGGGTGTGAGLGTPYAATNYTNTAGVVSSTDGASAVLAVWDLVAGAESRVSMTVGDTSVSGKLILDRVRDQPAGTGFYGNDLAVFKNYGGAGVVQNGSASSGGGSFSTPNGVDVVLSFHRHVVGGVDTISVEGSTDAGISWTPFDSMLPEAGVDYFVKYAASAGETSKDLAQTGYVPSV